MFFGREKNLVGRKVAILASDGFEQSELFEPKRALEAAGAEVHVISFRAGTIQGWHDTDWGREIRVDRKLSDANPATYDALMLPGGVINSDRLRGDAAAIKFIAHFAESGKPLAAICHAPWALIETGLVGGHTLTSWPSLRTDLENAGADWVDREVVSDKGWVTSRKPDDLPAFNKRMIEAFAAQAESLSA